MNYGQIISQAWQIVKREKLLWIFCSIYFLRPFIVLNKKDDLLILCLSGLLQLFSFFVMGLSEIGMLLCAAKVIRKESPSFKEIWLVYKPNFGRWILLSLVVLIPCGILFLCAALTLAPVYALFNNAVDDMPTRIVLAGLVSGPFSGGIYTICFYGMFLHGMGVLKSVRHGLSVFSMNWFKFVVLSLILSTPLYAAYSTLWFTLVITGNHPTLITLFQEAAKFPVQIGFFFINSVIFLFSSVSFLLVYYQFNKSYDYPTLKQVTPTT